MTRVGASICELHVFQPQGSIANHHLISKHCSPASEHVMLLREIVFATFELVDETCGPFFQPLDDDAIELDVGFKSAAQDAILSNVSSRGERPDCDEVFACDSGRTNAGEALVLGQPGSSLMQA